MSWRLVQAINESFKELSPDELGTVAGFDNALDAIRASGLEMNAVERNFLSSIPAPVWSAMASSIASAATSGKQLTFDLARGFGYSVNISTASQSSRDVAIVLQAPDQTSEYGRPSIKKVKARAVKARTSAKRKIAKGKPARSAASKRGGTRKRSR